MPAALSLNPSTPPGDVQARLGFAGSVLRVQGHASLGCAYAAHGSTVEIAVARNVDTSGQGYALLAARDFVMTGAGRDLNVQWGESSPTSLRLAVRLGSQQASDAPEASRLWVDLPA